jgi:hypothetical protein
VTDLCPGLAGDRRRTDVLGLWGFRPSTVVRWRPAATVVDGVVTLA